jgi:tight adherence protein C
MDTSLLLPLLIAALVGIGALALVAALGAMRAARPTLGTRLSDYLATGQGAPMTSRELELSEPFFQRVIAPILSRTSRVISGFFPRTRMQELNKRLIMAGRPGGLSATDFLGVKVWAMLLVGGGVGAFGYLVGYPRTTQSLVMWLGLTATSFALPDFWLGRRVRARQEEIALALPDTLDMLVIGVEAGLNFENALLEIINKWNHALSQELQQVQRDIGIGLQRRHALAEMAERTGVPDLSAFVAALNQAEELGVSISRVLLVQAEEMRIKRRQRAQEKANQAPIKMLFPMVFLIFPALFAVLLGPGIPSLLKAIGGI